ncbi:oligopeptide/dipeptide ABC transporter ATP-binding protein [Paenibacillus apiarius]|uniref:oligopeptide/dipeptide ABC transporter ATP-binding protein n=1 Tax=Paenibacillus apiarius TaxID=46240 RepID=UPI001980BA53|nr:ABC transporter ATP-binding protein [Paenibacillus apiarius]MBN3527366.1 ABC transporter ATP-binding protein [Paenibacillus apiarius]
MEMLQVNGLVKHYGTPPLRESIPQGPKRKHRPSSPPALDGVSFTIGKAEAFGLVGESGSGKSTLARMICRMDIPTAGQLLWNGEDITALRGKGLKSLRQQIQMIFQDPVSSLSPYQTVEQAIREPLRNFGIASRSERGRLVRELLKEVGLDPKLASRYPSELSGGQNQRVNIARALVCKPSLVVCDEPLSSLDAPMQTQVLTLLARLREQHALSYLFISHDLLAVQSLCDRIAVMYRGAIVEIFESSQMSVIQHHPYTKLLLSSILIADPLKRHQWEEIETTKDDEALSAEGGCSFYERCPFGTPLCRTVKPQLKLREGGHYAACHELDDKGE